MENVSLLARSSRVLSFISPASPLIPGYLSFISGVSLEEMRAFRWPAALLGQPLFLCRLSRDCGRQAQVIVTSCSSSSVSLLCSSPWLRPPSSASTDGASDHPRQGRRRAPIIFGLHTIGVFKIPWLLQEKRVHMQSKPAGMIGATVVGISFAFGSRASVDLAAILAVAAQQESISQGIIQHRLFARPRHPVSARHGHQAVLHGLLDSCHYHDRSGIRVLMMRSVLIFTNRFTSCAVARRTCRRSKSVASSQKRRKDLQFSGIWLRLNTSVDVCKAVRQHPDWAPDYGWPWLPRSQR
jgi:hypothetical protein